MIEILEHRIAPAALHYVDTGGINENNGATISGKGLGSYASLEIIPDINGDGIDDLVIQTPGQDSSTVAYVVYGRETPFPAKFKVTKMKPHEGFKVLAPAAWGPTGFADSADLNGDGVRDLIFGASYFTVGVEELGATIVLYGGSDFGKKVDLAQIDASTGVMITGALHKGGFGGGDSAGDVNGDGIDDLIVSASGEYYNLPGPIPTGPITRVPEGAVYVIFGSAELPAALSVSQLDGSNGFAIKTDRAMAGLGGGTAFGDVNGDGLADFTVRVQHTGWSTGGGPGAPGVYLLYGRSDGFDAEINVTSLPAGQGVRINTNPTESSFSGGVTALGDANGDGLDDIGVINGATAYILYGNDDLGSSITLSTAPADQVFKFRGTEYVSFRNLGDWNKDGLSDFAVVDNPSFSRPTHETYVIFGSGNLPSEMTKLDVDGFNGFVFSGPRAIVSNGGDLNGDGQVDLAFVFDGPQPASPDGPLKLYFGSELKISANGKKATWSDPDGDLVTLKVTNGTLQGSDFTFGVTGALQKLDLSDASRFTGATITTSVKRSQGGDGVTAIGYIDASGVDLKSISIKGDVGRIHAGDLDFTTPGLKKLSIGSLGRFGVETQPQDDRSSDSVINGILKQMDVRHDIAGVSLSAQRIDSLKVGGSIVGTADANVKIFVAGMPLRNELSAPATIGSLKVGGGMQSVQVLVGFDQSGMAVNNAVRVGKIAVGGDWRASSLSVGVDPGPDGYFGTGDDFIPTPGNGYFDGVRVHTLDSIQIGGQVYGSPESGDHFAIVAGNILKAKVSGETLGTPGSRTGHRLASTGDVTLGIVSR